jgi:hypothetical protein
MVAAQETLDLRATLLAGTPNFSFSTRRRHPELKAALADDQTVCRLFLLPGTYS